MKSTSNKIECYALVGRGRKPLWDSLGDGFYKTKKEAQTQIDYLAPEYKNEWAIRKIRIELMEDSK